MKRGNVLHNIPESVDDEIFENLVVGDTFRLERIVSHGQATPEEEWYDQDRDEWVLLLAGSAAIQFEDQLHAIELKAGDYVLIPAHKRHRVEWTDKRKKSIWLALRYEGET